MLLPWLPRAARATIAIALCLPAGLALAPAASAATTPAFQLPFPCGEVWIGTTYKHHGAGDNAVDFSFASGANGRRAVVSSAAGTVVNTTGWKANGELVISHGGGWETVYAHLDPAYPAPSGRVAQGALLGYIDPTPNPKYVHPDGFAHLHYEQALWGVQRDAVFNGARFSYGTAWRSANCSRSRRRSRHRPCPVRPSSTGLMRARSSTGGPAPPLPARRWPRCPPAARRAASMSTTWPTAW